MKDLAPNQFVIHGDLYVPRTEARRFKQNYLNGFITAELKVKPASPFMSLVSNAKVIDESNDKRFDLFQSAYICMGNGMVFDTSSHIYWLTFIHNKKLSWYGATNLLTNLYYKGFKGWRLPTLTEFTSLHNKAFRYYFNFHEGEFHTNTISGKNDKQHNFVKNKTYNESMEQHEYFTYVMPNNFDLHNYNIFQSRFLEIGDSMLFDTNRKVIWIKRSLDKTMTWLEAIKFLKQFSYQGLKGWRLPTKDEFESLYDNTVNGLYKHFNFQDGEYHTKDKYGDNDMQHNPRKHRTYKESINQRERIAVVI